MPRTTQIGRGNQATQADAAVGRSHECGAAMHFEGADESRDDEDAEPEEVVRAVSPG